MGLVLDAMMKKEFGGTRVMKGSIPNAGMAALLAKFRGNSGVGPTTIPNAGMAALLAKFRGNSGVGPTTMEGFNRAEKPMWNDKLGKVFGLNDEQLDEIIRRFIKK